MHILESEDQIRAAIAMMNPVARVAAQSLANYLLDNPTVMGDADACNKAYYGACFFAMEQAGWNVEDQTRVTAFFENHGDAVANIAMSIVVFAVNQAENQRKWGWVGKAAAFVGGALVASFFG